MMQLCLALDIFRLLAMTFLLLSNSFPTTFYFNLLWESLHRFASFLNYSAALNVSLIAYVPFIVFSLDPQNSHLQEKPL